MVFSICYFGQWHGEIVTRSEKSVSAEIIQYNSTIIREISTTLHIICTTTLSTQETATVTITAFPHMLYAVAKP